MGGASRGEDGMSVDGSTTERHIVTIIAEAAVEARLIADVKRLGAKGYSIGHVRGEGTTGSRLHDLNGPSVRLETVVTEPIAEAILAHLAAEYFDRFAVVAWVSPALVMRPGRF
jgi:nitrogen regulatory protein P-II 2